MFSVKQKKYIYYDLKINILTAVHIGTGDTLDPFQYIIDNNDVFHRFNMEDIIETFNEQQTKDFNEAIKQNNLHHLRKFIKNNYDKKTSLYSYNVDKNTVKEYNKRINDPGAESYMEIHSTMRCPNGTPFIPGSSIKGALRTAVLDSCVSKDNKAPKDDKFRNYEGEILGALNTNRRYNVANDPFNKLKISDCNYPDNDKNILLAKITNLGPKGNGVEQLCEILLPVNQNRKKSVATGSLSIESSMTINGKSLSIEDIAEKCRSYFIDALNVDIRYFEKMGNEDICEQIKKVKNSITNLQKLKFPLRIGRFCGKHSMTFKNAIDRLPGTRNLAYKIYPLGWVVVDCNRQN